MDNAEKLAWMLESNDRMWLCEMMIKIRTELSVSQEELAQYVGVTQSTISRLESGRGNPTYLTLMRIARVAHMRIDFV